MTGGTELENGTDCRGIIDRCDHQLARQNVQIKILTNYNISAIHLF